jgi:tetraacyldisaccharide 4'-kinase
MKTPDFWRHRGWQSLLLAPFGWIYGALTLRHMAKPGWRARVPVISVGNFTAGGAGKTPTAIAIAKALIARGEHPFFLTRGHGGREVGPLPVDPSRHSASDVGDEPLLLARHAPVIVARDRAAGARMAIAEGASCLVLDDALQNPALTKDFSLAVVDGGFGFGNGQCVPAGPLRAPVAATLAHVHAVLVIGKDETGAGRTVAGDAPVFAANIRPAMEMSMLSGREVIALCGIGRPEKFRETLTGLGATVVAFHAFADHHNYSDTEARNLLANASERMLVTTEKDHVRLKGTPALDALAARAMPVPIEVALDPALVAAIYRAVDSLRSR